jgi:hypothetical protein
VSENTIQTSFASGELAPSLLARTDLAIYHTGLATCRNFFVDYRSGISSRTGTKYVIQCLKSATAVRLIGFSQSVTTTYVIEFGDRYCRFINNGAPVLESPFSITSINLSVASQAVIPGNNFNTGDVIFVTAPNGMPQINGRYLQVGTVGGGAVNLLTLAGVPLDTSAFTAYAGGGTASRVYTIVSPYAAADLALIKFVQSVSVLFITHPSYPPTTLTFLAPTNWVFASVVFGTTILAPTGLNAVQTMGTPTPTNPNNVNYSFVVTAIDANGQESLASAPFFLNAQVGAITLNAGTITYSWNASAGAIGYNLYAAELSFAGQVPAGAAYGFVGTCTGTSFVNSNITPDFTTTPPNTNNNPFAVNNNPGCVVFFQQRAYYASTTTKPATFWASQPGNFNNFNFSDPIQADDEITGTIVSTQLNSIRWMLPMPGGLIFGTGHGAFTLSTGQGANATLAVTPANATIVPQAYNGTSDVPPVIINEDILYVQAKGSIVRDLAYNIYAAIYTGTDVSIRSNHFFLGRQIVQWTYAEEPYKIVWAVRDDGILLSLTFVKEQQIIGWARHDTLGLYKSVASVQEGTVDATYEVVQRFIGGNTVQFIERMADRLFTYGAEDAWSVDAAIQSSLPTPAADITISGSTGSVTVLASTNVFSSASIGQVLRAGGGIISITTFVAANQIMGTVTKTIAQVIPNSGGIPVPFASGTWSIATPAKQFFGLDYLIGQTVSILADGGVVPPQVVANDGSITLASPATKVVAGLGYQCQMQTMPLDTGEPTIQGKRKKVAALNLKLVNTRGLKCGRTFNTLIPMKDMNISVSLNTPIALVTGDARIVMDPLWDVPGQLCIQLDDPLPATILGVIPEVVIGDTK